MFRKRKDLIVKSFEITGITQLSPEFFHSTLKQIITWNDTSTTILDDLDGTEDLNEMFVDDEELDFLSDEESLSDSDDENFPKSDKSVSESEGNRFQSLNI